MSGPGSELAAQLAQHVGVTPEQANIAISVMSKILLQKAEPNKASSLLSKLPSRITNMFSENERQQFSTTQQNNR